VPGRKLEVEERKWKDGGRFSTCGDGWKTLVNPGSVGQPRDGNPLSRFAVFDSASREVEIFCVQYDVGAAQNAVIAAGFALKISERLALGQ